MTRVFALDVLVEVDGLSERVCGLEYLVLGQIGLELLLLQLDLLDLLAHAGNVFLQFG